MLRKTTLFLPLWMVTAATPALALNKGNAGPTEVELRFNLPPPAPLTPEQSLKAMSVEPGYRVELVAAEPMVEAPVAVSWDEQGRLYVVEMRGYMHDTTGSKDLEPLGRVKLLTDTDGDGRMDKACVFLDGLILPRSVMAVNGGALVAEPPMLWFCRDLDGDGVADVKQEVAADFGSRTGQPEHMANSPVWALDNSVWFANWPTRLRWKNGAWMRDAGLGRGQYGLCQDDFGRLFYNYNSDLLRCDPLPADAFAKNPLFRAEASQNFKTIKDQTVWPAHPTPGVNRGYEPKTLRDDGSLTAATAACGALVYRGDANPGLRGNAFVPEPSGNLVKRLALTEKDGRITAANPTPGREFLTSTDERFRPVVMSDGPDGALYVVDMARGIIQHSGFLTHYLVANIGQRKLAEPLNLGRIWRIVPEKGSPRAPVKMAAEAKGRAAQLSHANGWVRDTAQRLLVESAAPDATEAVVAALSDAKNDARGLVHALWTLDGLGTLTAEHLKPFLNHGDAKVRATAVRLAQRDLLADVAVLAGGEKDALVQAHLALKLSAFGGPDADAALVRVLGRSDSPLVREGALTGLRGREAAFATLLAADAEAGKQAAFFESLAGLASAGNKAKPIDALLALAAGRTAGDPVAAALLRGLSTSATAKSPKLVWLDAEPPALSALRTAFASGREAGTLAAVESRIAWPGKPGAPEPPKIAPLTPPQGALFEKGRTVYATLCAGCHQPHGFGLDGLAPPLVDSEWVLGKPEVPARILLHGLAGPLKVGNRTWNLAMPPMAHLSDEDVAGVLTYIRREWDHGASPVAVDQVKRERAAQATRALPWTAAELKKGG